MRVYNGTVKRVAVLGSTGSIGIQTLDVISRHRDRLHVEAIAACSNFEKLREQAAAFGVKKLGLYNESAAQEAGMPGGMAALEEIATDPSVDVVVIAVAGVIGLIPTLAAIRAGKMIALASKEVLVAAGEIVMPLARQHGTVMTPIDSEHSAVFQCLQGYRSDEVEKLILTASGGPFRGRNCTELANVSVQNALIHPTWRMGGKITIDSATMMNKGLETIEAKWLFGLEIDQVEVVIHPQSIVHSFVQFKDGSVLGQLGWPDMRLPIQYALLYPERVESGLKRWSPVDTPQLNFETVDTATFGCLELAKESVRTGGTMPCAMNAANEEAANAFLRGEIPFLGIESTVRGVMEKHSPLPVSLESVLETDRWARETAECVMRGLSAGNAV